MNCIICNANLQADDKMYFCPFCLAQIKCKSCKELLIKNAIGCLSCGTAILKGNSNTQSELNQIEFEQKGDLKKFKATFTDNVGHDLVSTFGSMIGVPAPKKKIFSLTNVNPNNPIKSIDESNIQEAEVIEGEEEIIEGLNQVFRVDGEILVFQTSNYKEKTKLEKEIRMALLVLLGYKHLHNSNEIKRKTLNEILKKSKLNTGNFRRWISKSDEIVQLKGGLITLTPTGVTKALGVLNEVLNPTITEGVIDFGKTSGSKRTSTKETNLAGTKSAKSPKSYLLKIIEEGFFKEKKSLSDITEHLKNDHAVTFKTTDISGHMGKFVNLKRLKREKGPKGYEYFI
ncbi:MAG: hypothetical protein ACOZCO_03225 [Bacteroidota bacterium]